MTALTTLHAASPLDADDASRLVFTDDTDAEILSRALDNVDSDFATMDTLTYTVQLLVSGAGLDDDTYVLRIRIVNGATILAAVNAGGSFQVITSQSEAYDESDADYGPTSFSYVNTSAGKSVWDGASVELQQGWTQSGVADVAHFEVDIVSFGGAYTQSTGRIMASMAGAGGLAGAGGIAGQGGGLLG